MKLLSYISLFSCAGVGCFGFKDQGFECIATNELLSKRLKIQAYNNKCRFDTGYIAGDITTDEVKAQIFTEIKRWEDAFHINGVDVVIATPPCQGMSVANHKKNNELGRNSLVVQSIKMIKEISPRFFIFENVKAFLKTICTDIDHQERTIGEAIELNLGGKYNILSKIINFKDYGSNSSRTRTLVIGVRKDLTHITPYDIFPKEKNAMNLRELFSDLPSLNIMGEISENDIYHAYRKFDMRMLPWIENLKEGESAFNNSELQRIPHQIKDGKVIYNQNKNGDKYARWYLDREGPCIHTRNDILASQNTIHPVENRVFSVRELMRMMSIPSYFKWSDKTLNELNQLDLIRKEDFLRKEELNIRHCIGEAVPTGVFSNIANNIKFALGVKPLSMQEINTIINKECLFVPENLLNFISHNFETLGLHKILQISEYANSSRTENSAFFTRADIAYSLVNDLPNFDKKKELSILEPAVGIGNFIPLLIEKYKEKEKVVFDLIDIDNDVLNILTLIVKKLGLSNKFEFNLINDDFLMREFDKKYDVVIGNPPYKKITNENDRLTKYKSSAINKDTNNIFSFFIEKSLSLGNYVALIIPKSLLSAPEFNKTREVLKKRNLLKITDYGEKGFKGVKIETMSFLVDCYSKQNNEKIIIESYITEEKIIKDKNYVFSDCYPYWLIYRNSDFDKVSKKMVFDIFSSFRDRQITKKLTSDKGAIRVLKSRNIGNNKIINIDNYDSYVDEIKQLAVSKYFNQDAIVMVPNLSYSPRATFLPKNSIADGSVALLTYKNNYYRKPTEDDLAYYSTQEFEKFYRIARNYGTRSLNIDNNSVFFFGLLKDN